MRNVFPEGVHPRGPLDGAHYFFSVIRIIISGSIVVCEEKMTDVVCAVVQGETILLW